MKPIFISYRRDDSADVTGRIYDRLRDRFGPEAVSIDVDNIPFGVDFRVHLDEQVSKCDVFLAVIGRDWLTIKNANGMPRLEDPGDVVRIEIESALKRDIPIVPLLVRGAQMPSEDKLPKSLRKLPYLNGLPVRRDPDFHNDLNRLTTWLNDHFQGIEAERKHAPASGTASKDEIRRGSEKLDSQQRVDTGGVAGSTRQKRTVDKAGHKSEIEKGQRNTSGPTSGFDAKPPDDVAENLRNNVGRGYSAGANSSPKSKRSLWLALVSLLIVAAVGVVWVQLPDRGPASESRSTPVAGPERVPAPSIAYFRSSQTTVTKGDSVRLTWQTSNAGSVQIDGLGSVSASGSRDVAPTQSTTYRLVATGDGASVSDQLTVNVTQPTPAPSIASFRASSTSVIKGGSVVLSWQTSNADSVQIDGMGLVAASGSRTIMPTQTITYRLVATRNGVSVSDAVTVTVSEPPSGSTPNAPTMLDPR